MQSDNEDQGTSEKYIFAGVNGWIATSKWVAQKGTEIRVFVQQWDQKQIRKWRYYI